MKPDFFVVIAALCAMMSVGVGLVLRFNAIPIAAMRGLIVYALKNIPRWKDYHFPTIGTTINKWKKSSMNLGGYLLRVGSIW